MKELISHSVTAIAAFLTGNVIKPFISDWLTDWRRKKEEQKEKNKKFNEVKNKMPELITKMKSNLENNRLTRQFLIMEKRYVNKGQFLGKFFRYFFDEDGNLTEKTDILEDAGYIQKIDFDNDKLEAAKATKTKKYKMTEEFVKLVLKS